MIINYINDNNILIFINLKKISKFNLNKKIYI